MQDRGELLTLLCSLLDRNEINIEHFKLGAFLIGTGGGRINYFLTAVRLELRKETEDKTNVKRYMQRLIYRLEMSGLVKRERRSNQWIIALCTGNSTGNVWGNTSGNIRGNSTGNNDGNATGNINFESEVANHENDCAFYNNDGNSIGNSTGNALGNAHKLIINIHKKEKNKEKKKVVKAKSEPQLPGLPDKPVETDEITLDPETKKAIEAVYQTMNECKKNLTGHETGFIAFGSDGNLTENALKLKEILEALSAQGLRAYNMTDGRYGVNLGMSKAGELVSSVFRHVSEQKYSKEDPKYYRPETLFNGNFRARLQTYLSGSGKSGGNLHGLAAMKAAFEKQRAEEKAERERRQNENANNM